MVWAWAAELQYLFRCGERIDDRLYVRASSAKICWVPRWLRNGMALVYLHSFRSFEGSHKLISEHSFIYTLGLFRNAVFSTFLRKGPNFPQSWEKYSQISIHVVGVHNFVAFRLRRSGTLETEVLGISGVVINGSFFYIVALFHPKKWFSSFSR